MRSLLCVGLLFATPGGMDVMVPGEKNVEHRLILEWDREALPFQFVATPTHGFSGVHAIQPGEPFRFSNKYGTKIVALPGTATLPPAGGKLDPDGPWPRQAVPVTEVRSVPASHPLAIVETSLRITRVTESSIEFETLGERRLDTSGRELSGSYFWPLILVASVGVAGLMYLGRTRRNDVMTNASA
ncbi:MAG: hypothetical protein AB7I19_10735 [Planctomycetota bacterium]